MSAAPKDTSHYGHQEQIDWQNVSVDQWQQQLISLNESQINASQRSYWMLCCRQWLDVHEPVYLSQSIAVTDAIGYQQVLLQSLTLAHSLCDWPLVIHLCHTLNELAARYQWSQEENLIESLVWAYGQMGQWPDAMKCLFLHIEANPEQQTAQKSYQQLELMLGEFPYTVPMPANELLQLTPLNECHMDDFMWQYANPDIARLCQLPSFENEQQWQSWLAVCRQDPNMFVFAVNHVQWGMIGSACLQIHEGVGYFYFWLGDDFQQYGYGVQTLQLLLDVGTRHLGMKACYAKASKSNINSCKAISKAGFKAITPAIESLSEDEVLFYHGPDLLPLQLAQEAKTLFDALNETSARFAQF